MKTKFLFLSFLILLLASCQNAAQNINLPLATTYSNDTLKTMLNDFYLMDAADISQPNLAIITQFKAHFPEAADLDWETRNDLHQVDFEISKQEYNALYDNTGSLLMCLYKIRRSEIPAAVKQTIKNSQYKKWHIDEAKKMVTAYETQYRIYMEKGEREVCAFFNESGEMIADIPK